MRRYKCNQCGLLFNHRQAVIGHLKLKHHLGLPYKTVQDAIKQPSVSDSGGDKGLPATLPLKTQPGANGEQTAESVKLNNTITKISVLPLYRDDYKCQWCGKEYIYIGARRQHEYYCKRKPAGARYTDVKGD